MHGQSEIVITVKEHIWLLLNAWINRVDRLVIEDDPVLYHCTKNEVFH